MTYRYRALARLGRYALLALGLLASAGPALAETPPKQIRLGGPALSSAGNDHWGWGLLGIAHARGLFQEEFKQDATTFEFVGLNTVPMVGEALASNQLDFAGQGDLISLIGRSAGVKTRYILPVSKFSNAYLAVKTDSPIQSIADLKGKRVAYLKGNYIHLQVIRILAANGLSERDVRQVSLDQATSTTALGTGDIDAVFGGPELLLLRNAGAAKIVYTTRDRDTHATAQTGLIVRDDFARQYPETTARIVKVLVRAAQWGSDEANKEAVYGPWWSFRLQEAIKEDTGDRPWSQRANPLFDPFLVAQYHDTYRLAKELRLLRGKDFDLDQWMDHSFLDQALKALKLEHHWQPLDASGTPIAEATE
ncbi:ABC transporter substrate-binding protein [Pseudomonas sp. RIT-PI-AD]|uniref:ABC transporter substrate-binding protein n=1 Tax=Pseudomonas sp. RIT-PI-AD TaxID=3035294 RepID=UPI0021DAC557|nr:ABC transporter substrate-binding protein [Pseudomonas sp. RIT-PI-AD]